MTGQRLFDLVRHQRSELFTADLITEEEYAELAAGPDAAGAVKRLDNYDAAKARFQRQITALRAENARLRGGQQQ